jgi:nucleoside-diphosphate-sugar epimerase
MTADLAEFCQRESIPLIYSSSAAIYGNSYPDPSPLNLYAWSKYLGERFVTAAGGVSLRYFNVYGATEYKKLNMASVATQAFLRFRNSKRPFHLFPGKPKRDFIHVSDVVTANLAALDLCQTEQLHYPRVFDVGTAETMTFEEVLDLMEVPYIYTASDSVPAGYQWETKARKDRWIPNWKPALPNREQFLIHRNDLLLLTSNRY